MIFIFIVTELLKYKNQYNKVEGLSNRSEEYISITYGSFYRKLVFLDSCRFLQDKLSNIAKSLDSKNLKILGKHFDTNVFKEKGIYSYEYITSL